MLVGHDTWGTHSPELRITRLVLARAPEHTARTTLRGTSAHTRMSLLAPDATPRARPAADVDALLHQPILEATELGFHIVAVDACVRVAERGRVAYLALDVEA